MNKDVKWLGWWLWMWFVFGCGIYIGYYIGKVAQYICHY